MNKVIVVTGASSGFGALAARALARASHMVYASMRETSGRNAKQVKEVEKYVAEHGVDLRAIELGRCVADILRCVWPALPWAHKTTCRLGSSRVVIGRQPDGISSYTQTFRAVFANGHLSSIPDKTAPLLGSDTTVSHCSGRYLRVGFKWIDSCEQMG